MSALPGEHYCLEHQGNHSHYAQDNCTVCKLQARVAELEREVEKWKSECEVEKAYRTEAEFELNKTISLLKEKP